MGRALRLGAYLVTGVVMQVMRGQLVLCCRGASHAATDGRGARSHRPTEASRAPRPVTRCEGMVPYYYSSASGIVPLLYRSSVVQVMWLCSGCDLSACLRSPGTMGDSVRAVGGAGSWCAFLFVHCQRAYCPPCCTSCRTARLPSTPQVMCYAPSSGSRGLPCVMCGPWEARMSSAWHPASAPACVAGRHDM